ncbi:MAG: DMT family transporter [Acidobacteria bacterium]|nr:DMT family transporter [Acidobacteriota bacterium]
MFLYLLILVMVLSWSGNFIAGKFALQELPPFALLFLRVWFSAALLSAIYFSSAGTRNRFTRADLRKFAELGLYGVALNQTGFTVGLHYTTVAHSSLIIALGPIFVLLLARWRRLEALTPRKLAGMGLAFAGVVILSSEHGFGSDSPTFLGDVITLMGSIAFAFYTVVGKRVALTYDTLAMNTYAYLTGAILVVPVAGWQLFTVPWEQVTWHGWLAVTYMAALASVVAYLIYYYALSKLSASRVAAFSYLQPVLATLFAVALLGESLSPQLLSGGTAVLVGVYLAERARG